MPFGFGIGSRNALARRRVFDEALPVPDDLADIESVLQHAVGAGLGAIERRRIPLSAAWPRNVFGIEGRCDFPRGAAGNIVGEDTPNSRCLALVDLVFAWLARHGAIAKADAATRGAGRYARGDAAAGFVAQLGEEHLAHQAFQPGMHRGDRAVRHRHYADAKEG
ncbi:hypothetical protein ASG47_19580 [Devosia sp. Leaf420]|nr:hypothetical protein ASG47_19580 [Devosia sp. Leaf420]